MHYRSTIMLPYSLPCLHAVISSTTHTNDVSLGISNMYDIVFFKITVNGTYSYGEYTRGLLS